MEWRTYSAMNHSAAGTCARGIDLSAWKKCEPCVSFTLLAEGSCKTYDVKKPVSAMKIITENGRQRRLGEMNFCDWE